MNGEGELCETDTVFVRAFQLRKGEDTRLYACSPRKQRFTVNMKYFKLNSLPCRLQVS